MVTSNNMKRLIILLFVFSKAYAQEPTYVPMKSNYLYRGIKMDTMFLPPSYADTSTATSKVNFAGSVVRVGSKLYMRNSALTQWVDLSASGGGGVGNLQQVTDSGNTTTNDIQFTNDNDLLLDTFSAVILSNNSRLQEGYIDAGYGGNKGVALVCGLGYEYKWEGGRLFVMNNSGNAIREARYMFTDVPDSSHDYTKGYYVGSRWVLDNGNTYVCTDNSLNAAVWVLQPNAFDSSSLSNRINNKVDSIKRIGDSVYFYKNGMAYFGFKDSVGSVSGFVPYTGATQDLDMGTNGVDARFFKVTGTAGSGHIELKHQSGDATGQANSTKLYANSQGYLKWKNDNLYYSTLAMPQTADRVYTYENKSYTLGDSADIAARVKYTDTATMLSPYQRSISAVKYSDTASMLNPYQRAITAMKYSDTATMLTPYLRKTDTATLSSRINNKQDQLNGTGFVKASGTTISYDNTTYASDDPLILGFQALGSTLKGTNLNVRGWSAITASGTLTNQRVVFTPIYLTNAATITGVKWVQVGQGNYTANNYNGVGLYTYSAGTLTLVASSTNDGDIWKGTANSVQSKAFSSTYSASAGIYYIGFLYSTSGATAAPSIGIGASRQNAAIQGDFTNSAKLTGFLATQTALPNSQASSGLTNLEINYGVFLY